MIAKFTIDNYVLTALADFVSTESWHLEHRPALTELLVEITSESLRLVATDTHALAMLHLTPADGHGVALDCLEPLAVTLPVSALKPLLRERKRPVVTVTIDTESMTATLANTAGMHATVACREGTEYVSYRNVIPTTSTQSRECSAIDASLLAKFGNLAKALGVAPYLQLEYREPLGPIAVTVQQLACFFGLVMPVSLQNQWGLPAWLLSATDERIPADALPVAA